METKQIPVSVLAGGLLHGDVAEGAELLIEIDCSGK
jgi:hypothetical protein